MYTREYEYYFKNSKFKKKFEKNYFKCLKTFKNLENSYQRLSIL